MPRSHSQTWSVADQGTAARLEDINEDFDALFSAGSDRCRAFLAVSETPLMFDVGAGGYRVGLAHGLYAGSTDNEVDDDEVTYVEIDDTGTLQMNTTEFSADCAPVAIITSAGGVITDIEQWRPDIFGGDLGNNMPGANVETLAGNKTLDNSSDQIQYLNANGTDRTVTLGTTSILEGRTFYLKNEGTSGDLAVKEGGTTLVTLYPGHSCIAQYTGSAWKIMLNLPTTKFGDGSDGALNVGAGVTTQIDCTDHIDGIVFKQYTSFTIAATGTLEFTNVPAGGIIFMPFVQGNWSVEGTIDGRGDGSLGGVAMGGSSYSTTQALSGNSPTAPNQSYGESHAGSPGSAVQGGSQAGSQNASNAGAGGGGGSGNLYQDGDANGTSTTGLTFPQGNASGGGKGVKRTQALCNLLAAILQLNSLCPGTGGPTGGLGSKFLNCSGSMSSVTVGKGGRGGFSMYALIGGTYNFTGTYDARGTDADSPAITTTGITINNPGSYAVACGGSVGGAGGLLFCVHFGALVADSGTASLTRGSSTNGVTAANTNGTNTSGNAAEAGNGGNSCNGKYTRARQIF